MLYISFRGVSGVDGGYLVNFIENSLILLD
jgi:hypothetical protein